MPDSLRPHSSLNYTAARRVRQLVEAGNTACFHVHGRSAAKTPDPVGRPGTAKGDVAAETGELPAEPEASDRPTQATGSYPMQTAETCGGRPPFGRRGQRNCGDRGTAAGQSRENRRRRARKEQRPHAPRRIAGYGAQGSRPPRQGQTPQLPDGRRAAGEKAGYVAGSPPPAVSRRGELHWFPDAPARPARRNHSGRGRGGPRGGLLG